MVRTNANGSRTPLTISNHKTTKASTLRTICTQAGIPREDFLAAYEKASEGPSDDRGRDTARGQDTQQPDHRLQGVQFTPVDVSNLQPLLRPIR